MSFLRNIVVWTLIPISGVLIASSTLEGFTDNESTIWVVVIFSLFVSYITDQAIERVRSPKLNALATRMGMQFDDNLSWIPFLTRTSNYACLEKTTVPFLNQCSGFRLSLIHI